jgi:hypothetical protein
MRHVTVESIILFNYLIIAVHFNHTHCLLNEYKTSNNFLLVLQSVEKNKTQFIMVFDEAHI